MNSIPRVALQKEIADWYGITRYKAGVWLNRISDRLGRVSGYGLSYRQLLILFDEFGPPECFEEAYSKLEKERTKVA